MHDGWTHGAGSQTTYVGALLLVSCRHCCSQRRCHGSAQQQRLQQRSPGCLTDMVLIVGKPGGLRLPVIVPLASTGTKPRSSPGRGSGGGTWRHTLHRAAQHNTAQHNTRRTSHHSWPCSASSSKEQAVQIWRTKGLLVGPGQQQHQSSQLTAASPFGLPQPGVCPPPVGVVYARKVLRQCAVAVLLLVPAGCVLQHQHVPGLVAAPLLSRQPAHAASREQTRDAARAFRQTTLG